MINDKRTFDVGKEIQRTDYFIDLFESDIPSGGVIGKSGVNGVIRKGIDIEKIIGIDHGALRIEPMLKAGWGRTGITYGPYKRKNGLALAVSILNGHNTSQTGPLRQSLKRRFYDWAYGSHAETLLTRCLQWIQYRSKKRTLRLWRRWWEIKAEERNGGVSELDENLAIGWFPDEVSQDPRKEGNAFIVHATGALNGELRSTIANEMAPLIRGLQNIPMYYIIILREQGAAYYAASVPDTPYLPEFPKMRPLAVDPFTRDSNIFASIYQGVLGQIGFRADTRVREFQVNHISSLDTWYGTAHIADRLTGEGLLTDRADENNKTWTTLAGNFERNKNGSKPSNQENMAVINADAPSGLIHLLLQVGHKPPELFSLIWRYSDLNNYFSWDFKEGCSEFKIMNSGTGKIIHSAETIFLKPNTVHSLQILDYGTEFRLYLDGQFIFGDTFNDVLSIDNVGLGFACQGVNEDFYLQSFEAHPRELAIPDDIKLRSQWIHPLKSKIIVRDDFSGERTEDLVGRETPYGKRIWQREIGRGKIGIEGDGCAKVTGSIYQPNPGRTAYLLPWNMKNFADLELDFVPPSHGPLEYEKSRVGLIFLQDSDNYITVSTFVDDYYDGSSIAFFYRLNGFEEIYDAIWSNVGREITWGNPSRARVVFDRLNFAILINGKAVCYRSLRDVYPDLEDFCVNKVGIVVNWEWGDDTGTVLREFTASEKV